MKIGIIAPFYYPNLIGGAEVSVKLLAEELAMRHNDVIVLSFDLESTTSSSENINGVNVTRYRTFTKRAQLLTLIPYVAKAMKKWEKDVDIYHVYNVSPVAGAALYKLLGGKKKVVATLNNYIAFCPIGTAICDCRKCSFAGRLKCLNGRSLSDQVFSVLYSIVYPFLRKASHMPDRYIALSQAVRNCYVENGFDKAKIVVIPNFSQCNFEKKAKLESTEKGDFNVLYVGRISKGKGTDILIRAFSRIARKRDKIQLILVGTGSKIDDFRRLARNLGVDDRVTFTGRLDEEDKCVYYSKADVFVHPAIWQEPFGRTLLEAMFFDLPLVVSNVGAPPEIVDNAGLVFESGSVEDLRRKIELVMDKPDLKERLKSNCATVLKKYDPNYVVGQIVKLYKDVVRT